MSEKNNNTPASNLMLPRVAFNVAGIAPSACKYNLNPSDIEKIMLKTCKEYSKDFEQVLFDFNKKDKITRLYAWIKADSRDIVDDTPVNSPNSIVNIPIPKNSDNIKKFMKAFCDEENRNFYPDSQGRPYKAIVLSLDRVFQYFFDTNGETYKRITNGTINSRVNVSIKTHWESPITVEAVVMPANIFDGNLSIKRSINL